MASTIPLSTSLYYAKTMIKNFKIDETSFKIIITQSALSFLWMYAPWRWTLNKISATPYINITTDQDYPATLPADFFYLHQVELHDITSDTPPQYLIIEPSITANPLKGPPKRISVEFISPNYYYRISPIPAAVTNTIRIFPVYKKKVPIIDGTNISQAATKVFDDEWMWIYDEILLYYAYKYVDDPRENNQLEKALKFLSLMAEREYLPTSEVSNKALQDGIKVK